MSSKVVPFKIMPVPGNERKPYEVNVPEELDEAGRLRFAVNHAIERGDNLSGLDFSHSALGEIKFTDVDVRNAWFSYADLSSCKFDGAQMDGCKMDGTNCRAASFNRSSMKKVRAMYANFEYAVLDNADMEGMVADGANFYRARFYDASLKFASLKNVVMASAFLQDCNAMGSNWSHACCVGVMMTAVNASGASFRKTDLRNSDINGCLDKALLHDTQFQFARFCNVSMKKARLKSLMLSELKWYSEHPWLLEGTDLSNVDLTGVDLERVNFSRATGLPDWLLKHPIHQDNIKENNGLNPLGDA